MFPCNDSIPNNTSTIVVGRQSFRMHHVLCLGVLGFIFFTPLLFSQDSRLLEEVADTSQSLIPVDTTQPEVRIGPFGGWNSTNARLENVDLVPQPRTGYHIGLRTEIDFGYPIYFLVEFEYAQKGIRTSYEHSTGVIVHEDFRFNYLDVPLLYRIGLPVAGHVSVSAGFGAHISLILSHDKVTRIGENVAVTQVEKGLEKFDFGLEGRIGGEYSLTRKLSLTADLRYLHGLQNILILHPSQVDTRSWKSRSMFLSLGLMYQLQRPIR